MIALVLVVLLCLVNYILLLVIFIGVKPMSATLDALTQAVSDNTTATQAAVTEIQSLAAGEDTAALQALTTSITANTTALNDAVAAAAPAPTTGA